MKSIVLVAILSSIAMADTVIYKEHSLIGIEGGVTSINQDVSNSNKTFSNTVGSIGFKIGAESRDYRIFLIADYHTKPNSNYNYIATYGAQLDYLLNVSSKMNLYFGANLGVADMKFKIAEGTSTRTISNLYYGPDAGMNFHVNNLIDLELGARFMIIDDTNSKNGATYNNFFTGYTSIIFKYNMD